MAVYAYKAVTQNGKVVTGKSEEVSRQRVIDKLRANNLTPINITEQRTNTILKRIMPKQKAKKNKVSAVAVTKLAREKLIEEQQRKMQKDLLF